MFNLVTGDILKFWITGNLIVYNSASDQSHNEICITILNRALVTAPSYLPTYQASKILTTDRTNLSQGRSIVQIKNTNITNLDIYYTTSNQYDYITELTTQITPSNNSNRVLVSLQLYLDSNYTNNIPYFNNVVKRQENRSYINSLICDTGSGAMAEVGVSVDRKSFTVRSVSSYSADNIQYSLTNVSWRYMDYPSSTGSIEYKVKVVNRVGQTVGQWYLNHMAKIRTAPTTTQAGSVATSNMTLMEIA